MKRTVLVWGLISGAVAVCIQWIVYSLCYRGYMSIDDSYVGYAGMLITFSMVFFGIKSYRDNYGGGMITFWKGVKIGLLITLIASVIHAVGWLIYDTVNPDFKDFFIQKYTEIKTAQLPDPADQAAAAAISEEVEMLKMIYSNRLLNFVLMAVFLLPVGFVVTLVSAALLRKKDVLPALQNKDGEGR